MAFADPQTFTINTVGYPLARLGFGDNSGTFGSADGATKLSISHSYKKRVRRVVRIDTNGTASDPLISGLLVPTTASYYLVCDTPKLGIDIDAQSVQLRALVEYVAGATNADFITPFLGGQS